MKISHLVINSCLSSIPLYNMEVYKLYEGNYQSVDRIRTSSFGKGLSRKKEIAYGEIGSATKGQKTLVVWALWMWELWFFVYQKNRLNDWRGIMKLFTINYWKESIWLIKASYKGRSQIWRGLIEGKEWYEWGRKLKSDFFNELHKIVQVSIDIVEKNIRL